MTEPFAAPLAFRVTLGGQWIATHWLALVGDLPGGRLAFESLIEQRAPSGVARRRAALVCDRDGGPVLYRTFDADGARAHAFAPERIAVELPEGRAVLPRAGAQLLADAFAPGLHVFLAAAVGDRAEWRTARYHASHLAVAPCAIRRDGDALVTSHGEHVVVERGEVTAIVAIDQPRDGLRAERCADPRPAWADEPDGAEPPPPKRYAPPPDIIVEDIAVPTPLGPLGGSLSLPRARPRGAALYLPGTGRPDRHGLLGPHDGGTHQIMDALARAGIAGLRCDAIPADRLAERVALARAQLDALHARAPGPPARANVILIGHSQGGQTALALAGERPRDVAGVVLVGAPGRPVDVTLAEQLRRTAAAQGWPAAALDAELAELAQVIDLARAGTPLAPGAVPDRLVLRARSQAWLADQVAAGARGPLYGAACPLLVCQGTADTQVTRDDAAALETAARAAQLPVEVLLGDGLDHFLQRGGDAVDEHVLGRIAAWITAMLDQKSAG